MTRGQWALLARACATPGGAACRGPAVTTGRSLAARGLGEFGHAPGAGLLADPRFVPNDRGRARHAARAAAATGAAAPEVSA